MKHSLLVSNTFSKPVSPLRMCLFVQRDDSTYLMWGLTASVSEGGTFWPAFLKVPRIWDTYPQSPHGTEEGMRDHPVGSI